MTEHRSNPTPESPRIDSHEALESALRSQSLLNRHTPSARLRQRTLSALQEQSQASMVTDMSGGQRRALAAAVLCACAILASILAFALPRSTTQPGPILVTQAGPVLGPATVEVHPANLKPSSILLSANVNLKNPLMTEAKLLARDVRQTVTTFQAGLPRRPRMDPARSTPMTSPALYQDDR